MSQMPTIVQTPPCGPAPAAKTGPASQTPPNSAEQMKSLAAQFESVLLGQMMKQMRDSLFSENDEDGKASGFAGGPLADQVYSQLSLALSQAGGVGLSDALAGALGRQVGVAGPLAGSRSGIPSVVPYGIPLPPGLDQSPLPIDAAAASGLLGPTGRVSSTFGWRQDPMGGGVEFHKGTDIAMPVGQDVQAAQAGKVVSVGDESGYGLTVVVSHEGGLSTRYAHLSEALVKVGDAVARGQVIAKSGSSGKSTGPHLHFEVIQEGQPVDPGGFVRF